MKRILLSPGFFIAAALLIILFFRLPLAIVPFFNADEGSHAVVADIILDGGVIYRDAIHAPGPITSYIYALVFLLFGRNNMAAVHFSLIFLIFATTVVIYLIGALARDKRTGCYAALLFSIFSYTYESTDMLAFHSEWPVVFFSALGAYFFLKYVFKTKSLFLLLSGFSFGLAFFSKQPAIFAYLAALVFLCIFEYNRASGRASFVKPVVTSLAGFFLVCAVFVFYFYINKALGDFWFCFWEIGSKYYVPLLSFSERLNRALIGSLQAGSFLRMNSFLLVCFVAACFIAAWRFVGLHRKPRQPIPTALITDLYFIAWGLFSYLGATYSGRQFGHYFILILPAFCIVSAMLMRQLSDPRSVRLTIRIFLAIAVIFGLAYHVWQYSWSTQVWKAYLTKNKAKTDFVSEELNSLAGYIENNSGKDDKIFVWGSAPEIYILANRMPASRHIWCSLLTDLIPGARQAVAVSASDSVIPQYWRMFMDELKKNQPKFIIDTSFGGYQGYGDYPPSKFKEFSGFLSKDYLVKRDFFLDGKPTFRLYERIK